MPGYLWHLWVAREVREKMITAKPDKAALMVGSLIPDLAANKHESHFRFSASRKCFFVPDMIQVEKFFQRAILNPERHPMHFGMFSHLYLDYRFIEDYLLKEYEWDSVSNCVTNKMNGCKFDIDFFFSREGLYKAYSNVNPEDIGIAEEDIPLEIPMTGMAIFDSNRHEKEWLQTVEHIGDRSGCVSGILEYDHLKEKIVLWADEIARFVDSKK